jgi:hypothetical protein
MAVQRIDDDILHQLAEGVLDGGDLDIPDSVPDASDPVPAVDGRIHNAKNLPTTEWPDHIRQLAFTVWAFEAGQNIGQTRDVVKSRTGVDIPLVTIRRWREEAAWRKLGAQVHQTLSSETARQVAAILAIGTVRAARWAVGAFDDENVKPETKARLALSILSRGGFPEAIRGELFDGVNGRQSMRDMDDADLDAAMERYLADENIETPEPPRALSLIEKKLQDQHARIDIAESFHSR